MYGGFVLSSVFDSQINSEMQSIGWNPFNNNESAVLAAIRYHSTKVKR